MTKIVIDPFPSMEVLNRFWERAWRGPAHPHYNEVLRRSLGHIGAFDAVRLVGFVNVAWDGGFHAFILDTSVDPDFRRQGLATSVVLQAVDLARDRGAEWVHVDYEPHLSGFYEGCGFRPTEAGLIKLK